VVLLAILWGGSSVAQSFGAQSQSTAGRGADNSTSSAQSGSTPKHKPEKEKHWSGSLVDVTCMMKAMSAPTGATNENSARPNAGSPQKEWLAAGPGQTSASPQMGPGQSRQTGVLPPGQNPDQNPDISQAQAAQMAQADKLESEANQCVATASTTAFGLVPSGGPMVRFDDEGNTKADEALKNTAVEPGKRVKAKVAGTLAGRDTINVSSVEIKGKHAAPASPRQGGR
jgi:hypothetical protein